MHGEECGRRTILATITLDKTSCKCGQLQANYLDQLQVKVYYTQETTAPTVGISGAPADWTNADQTATVTCDDGSGSGCDAATYKIKTDSSNPGTCSTTYSDYEISESADNFFPFVGLRNSKRQCW